MDTSQIITELKKLPMSPKTKEELSKPGAWNEIEEGMRNMPVNKRVNAFNFTRLSFYLAFIDELGYLPSEFIMGALGSAAVSLRSIGQLDDGMDIHSQDSLLHLIRKIGEGIASAEELDKVKHNETHIYAYSHHEFIEGLSSEATAGDCFLFNVMFYSTGRSPFKDIPISSVVEQIYSRFNSVQDASDTSIEFGDIPSILSISLDAAAKEIFSKNNSSVHASSGVPISEKSNTAKYILIAVAIFFLWIVFK